MGPRDVIRATMDLSDFVINSYLKDLSDSDLRLRPIEGMHPIALQLGHLIVAERMFKEWLKPGSSPPLPEGFAETHDIKNDQGDDSRFKTKDEYLRLWKEQRDATKAILDSVSDEELDDTRGGSLPQFAPNVGAV